MQTFNICNGAATLRATPLRMYIARHSHYNMYAVPIAICTALHQKRLLRAGKLVIEQRHDVCLTAEAQGM